MTAPEPRPMLDTEGDYLLGAALGLAQGARLIPVALLVEHFETRYAEARRRGTAEERHVALEELGFAHSVARFVGDAETLMDARRNTMLAEVRAAKAEAQQATIDVPPSQRPLAEDDVWVTGPARPR